MHRGGILPQVEKYILNDITGIFRFKVMSGIRLKHGIPFPEKLFKRFPVAVGDKIYVPLVVAHRKLSECANIKNFRVNAYLPVYIVYENR
jgi:hypothetical protein